ncbi:hypothetical protein ACWEQ8_28605 [Streptomyces noursei]
MTEAAKGAVKETNRGLKAEARPIFPTGEASYAASEVDVPVLPDHPPSTLLNQPLGTIIQALLALQARLACAIGG